MSGKRANRFWEVGGFFGDYMTRDKDFKAGNGSWPFFFFFFLASSEGRGITLIKPFLLGFFFLFRLVNPLERQRAAA